MICSISRPDKPCEDTKNFVEKAKGLSVKAEIFPVKMNHGEINKSLGLNNELTKRVDFFLKQIGV